MQKATIKIFLASSSELEDDRIQFEIFINRKNKYYSKEGKFLHLVLWEDFFECMSPTRLQDEYNKAITNCDVFVSLFHTKVGQYTEEEFLTALETFQAKKKPLIYTYFKDEPINISELTRDQIISLLDFQDKLWQLGHFYRTYKNIDELKYLFDQQLTKFMPDSDKINGGLEGILIPNPPSQEKPIEVEGNQLAKKESEIPQLQIEIPVIGDEASEVGADYTKLRDLLQNQEFGKADLETANMILWVAKRDTIGWLDRRDIEKFPSQDLWTINQLWLSASKGKFGFSVQKQIWLNLGGKPGFDSDKVFNSFLDKVEWHIPYNKVCFDQRAVRGHLPLGMYVLVDGNIFYIFNRWGIEIQKILKKEQLKKESEIRRLESEVRRLKERDEPYGDRYLEVCLKERDRREEVSEPSSYEWVEWEGQWYQVVVPGMSGFKSYYKPKRKKYMYAYPEKKYPVFLSRQDL